MVTRLRGLNTKIQAAARERGLTLEGVAGQIPDIYNFARPYWDAFDLLRDRRPLYISMAGAIPGHIPISEIRGVASLFGFRDTDLEFVQIMVALDTEWLAIHAERQKDKAKPHVR